MAKRKQKKTKKRNDTVGRFLRPTEASEAHNDFESAGVAVRAIPPIVTMHRRGDLTQEEFDNLAYYRDQALLAERSLIRDSCDFSPRGGSGNGPGVAILSAQLETHRMERDMGQLVYLCRAICVDDKSIEQWCVDSYGTAGPDSLKPSSNAVGIATLELKYAAGGIVR